MNISLKYISIFLLFIGLFSCTQNHSSLLFGNSGNNSNSTVSTSNRVEKTITLNSVVEDAVVTNNSKIYYFKVPANEKYDFNIYTSQDKRYDVTLKVNKFEGIGKNLPTEEYNSTKPSEYYSSLNSSKSTAMPVSMETDKIIASFPPLSVESTYVAEVTSSSPSSVPFWGVLSTNSTSTSGLLHGSASDYRCTSTKRFKTPVGNTYNETLIMNAFEKGIKEAGYSIGRSINDCTIEQTANKDGWKMYFLGDAQTGTRILIIKSPTNWNTPLYAYGVYGAIYNKYVALGGTKTIGYPVDNEKPSAVNGISTSYQYFDGDGKPSIQYVNGRGTFLLKEGIRKEWLTNVTKFGVPIGDEVSIENVMTDTNGSNVYRDNMAYQVFDKSLLFWSKNLNQTSYIDIPNCNDLLSYEPVITTREISAIKYEYCRDKIPKLDFFEFFVISPYELITNGIVRDAFFDGFNNSMSDTFVSLANVPKALKEFDIYNFDLIAETINNNITSIRNFNHQRAINSLINSARDLVDSRGYDRNFYNTKDKRTLAYLNGYYQGMILQTIVSAGFGESKLLTTIDDAVKGFAKAKDVLNYTFKGNTKYIAKSKIATYSIIDSATSGTRFAKQQSIQHLVDQRILEHRLKLTKYQMNNEVPSILLDNGIHQNFTNSTRKIWGYKGDRNYIDYEKISIQDLRKGFREVYKDYPELADSVDYFLSQYQ